MSTYEERQAYRDAHPGVIVDNNSSSDGGFTSSTPNGTPSGAAPASSGGNSGGGGGGQQQQQQQQTSGNAAAQLAGIQQSILNAIGSGNKAAADQAAAQFAQTFGLDTQKFQESVRQYNQNFTLAQAGITGTYNGAPTEAALEAQQAAAEKAREFDVTSASTALDNANKTALGVLSLTAGLHSDPFRQLNVMYGANGIDGLHQAVNGLTGQYGLPGSFTAPAGANSANLGGLTNEFNNAASGSQLAAGTGLNNTNQIIARNYNSAPQNVKDAATSALSMNTGVDQASVDKAIQNNLPKFTSPDFGLASV